MSLLGKKVFGGAMVALFSCLGACVFAPGEIATDAGGLTCSNGQVQFNGACHQDCTTTQTCATPGTRCTAIDGKTSACLDETVTCAYLSSDTECAGRGGYYEEVGRGTYELWVEYSSFPDAYSIDPSTLTSNSDPYFTPAGYQPSVQSDGFGCQGNAVWTDVPATGTVACGAKHAVQRCRLVAGRACELVTGTTDETVLPAK